MNAAQPLGVFDSGVGGVSVLRAIRAALPHEDIVYVADSAHVPYGDKSAAFIQERALALTAFLLGRGAKTVVVACNTASSAALALLRQRYPVPIVGMEPAIKPAAQLTRTGVVGVLATSRTLMSERVASLLSRFRGNAAVHLQPCPGLVEQVEAGDLSGPATRALVEQYLTPLLRRGADTIVLGCTHYPFLRPLIQEIAGPTVAVIDPNAAVARELHRRLAAAALLAPPARAGGETFWTSGSVHEARRVIRQLWGGDVSVQALA